MIFRTLLFSCRRAVSALACGLAASVATAQTPPAPQGVVNLSASASAEVARDLISLTLSTHREAADADTVQQQLKQALDAALAEARKAARPGQVDVRTGAFNVGPREGEKGAPTGWQGQAQLVLEGRDMAAIGQLAGRIQTMTVERVGYDLSRELRTRTEGEVSARAIAQFQARAADCARQFGYAGYTLGEVAVNAADTSPPHPMAMRAMKATRLAADAPLPLEAGFGTVTVSVSGSVQLTRRGLP